LTPTRRRRPTVARYRKKPVEIEAVQYRPADKAQNERLAHHLDGCTGWRADTMPMGESQMERPVVIIPTLEGDMLAQAGDWIIKGVQGEFYPCKPDIFEATYEPVEASDEG
jgi:hypothetical protein